ncbi:hypothetical protein B0H12DRAFT_1070276 [Mycena haematopus]|nr:hypothetical protein B0H12DRAFT_1070276 [Mycena haematopus]
MAPCDGADPLSTTCETRSNAPRPTQDTSVPPSAPPEFPPETPKAPKALAVEIRECLSKAHASGKKPNLATYKDLFTLLDALCTALDDKEVLTSSLDVFKAELMAQIQTALTTRPYSAPTYSAAAASPARTSPAPAPVAPTAPVAKVNEFVVALDAKDEVLVLPVVAIKERVAAALAASGVPSLQEVELKGVKVLPHGRLLVATHYEKSVTLLKQTASYWTPKLSKDSQLVVPNYRVVVNSVPKTFKPDNPHAAQELYAHNRAAIADPSVIKEVAKRETIKFLVLPRSRSISLAGILTGRDPRAKRQRNGRPVTVTVAPLQLGTVFVVWH